MKPPKTNFEDRLAAQAEARKAMLANFRPKPNTRETPYVDTAAQRRAELEAIRAKRAEEREAKRAAAAEAERLRLEAEAKEKEAQVAAKMTNQRAALLAMYGAKRRK